MVAPRPLENRRSKHQKTDRLDARALLNNLESYLRGNRDAMSIVAIPSPEQEQRRSVVRHREQLVRNRRRAEARGRTIAGEFFRDGEARRGFGSSFGNILKFDFALKNMACHIFWPKAKQSDPRKEAAGARAPKAFGGRGF